VNASKSTNTSDKSNQSSMSAFENAFNNIFSTSSQYGGALYGAGLQREKTTLPVLQQFASQTMEAMRTGGVGTNIPIVSRALDASTAASGQNMESLRQTLARSGYGGSSFATNALTGQSQAAGQQAAAIGPGIAQSFIGAAPQIGLDTGGLSAMGQAAGLTTTGTSSGTTSSMGRTQESGVSSGTSTTTSNPGFWNTFLQGLSGGADVAGAFA
jgi:hypothetical protein